jgi:hypothetical protein
MEWMAVTERLPELRKAGQCRCSNSCLVFFDDCIGIAFLLDDGSDTLWRGHGGSHNMVTHWMPLPPPPKEQK